MKNVRVLKNNQFNSKGIVCSMDDDSYEIDNSFQDPLIHLRD